LCVETQSKKYARRLNDIQGVGKSVSIQTGEEAWVQFDIYSVR
jgi:hypothetical protein